ncbi:hypothetical protein COCMIDRAFT_80027 [Bipolaris oryzae ATCC 44560]|uniref:WSC domain-containing protein n=1 Tax=Bipolaris oryzae ATCC 44560 TaxID=930090 RepID=W6ZUI3_COCMI|nr:uncharacterized protein COCMIDRAFT_80027 [Bipolaris oryzae ATCC 44560]EUC51169.1 hypothetical protein COCMIDRAFT_80027 [Bipolaris oryzae ATCC 44560]
MKEQQHLETERDLQRQVDTCKSNTWRYEGCYRDSERRVLSLMSEAADMTREKCAATCTKYKYYGVEFARYCFCGNSFEAPTEQIAESNCNTKCVGSSDMCGGGWALSMHAKEV